MMTVDEVEKKVVELLANGVALPFDEIARRLDIHLTLAELATDRLVGRYLIEAMPPVDPSGWTRFRLTKRMEPTDDTKD